MTDNPNSNLLLLPPQTNSRKTLVLDLDETLVHSQFMQFDNPSDVIIKINIDDEIHDIHVMVRPGVKELLEKMEKYYEIVIFTASVSKYADPLLNIIDDKGLCPYRLFREHCTLINTTFVKDLQRLGRDLKDVVIVDNSPLSYILHPDNGLPIQTWFEDKTDRELYKIIPILEFLSNVSDVRVYISKIVDNNVINYDKALKIINEFNETNNVNENNNSGNRIIACINKENDKKIIDNNLLKKSNNIFDNANKENYGLLQDKLMEVSKKNIIASVDRPNVMNGNAFVKKQSEKDVKNNKKNGSKIKIQITESNSNLHQQKLNIVNNNKNSNNNLHTNTKKTTQLFTKNIFSHSSQKLQKNVRRTCNSAVLDKRLHKQPTDYSKKKSFNNVKKSQAIKHIYNTPKNQRLAHIFNKSNKVIDIYPLFKNKKNVSTSQTSIIHEKNKSFSTNPVSKSQTKNNLVNQRTPQILNKFHNNVILNNLDNRVITNTNKVLYSNNSNKENQLKFFNTNTNIAPGHKKQKSFNNFVSYQKNSKKVSMPATPKNVKITKKTSQFSEHRPQKSLNNISNNLEFYKTNRETNKMKRRIQNNRYQNNNTLNKLKSSSIKKNTLYDSNTVRHKTAYNGKINNRSTSMKTSVNIENNNKFSKSLKYEITEILHKRGISIAQIESSGKFKKLIGDKKGVTNRKNSKK